MSAAAAWTGIAPVPAAPSATHPHLRLVVDRPAAVASRLRLTRRGRLVLTAAAVVVLAVVAGLVAARPALAGDTAIHQVVVPAGSTLSQVAAEELPDRPLEQAIADLQRTNGLTSTEVSAGQVLVVPGR